ncbi:hypothetical protein ACFQXB_04850 [Plastorhodobacter daqingensis]|uniref:DUF2934 domain-containing protein n=1 Tax=Plastorhodobacter daqingensis TaxID=1387281 RepID=A0ABW2UFT8_9RHOB
MAGRFPCNSHDEERSMNRQEFDAWEARIEDRARVLWQEAGAPEGAMDLYRDRARELLALEEVPEAGHAPRDQLGPAAEPKIALQNQGEFPDLRDQGSDRDDPSSR